MSESLNRPEKSTKIEKHLALKHLESGRLVLYDVTSTYLEGNGCELGKYGYNLDKKKGKTQIVFGLLCSAKGCPIAVEVFEGNTSDGATLSGQIEKLATARGFNSETCSQSLGQLLDLEKADEDELYNALDCY